ncbi:hypothetical protein P4R25_001540 [Campylobacter jejuni]|uniref:hypothetical protein n=1 Tax=Campylobacter jejuni TaxID=197 RepID=UPI001BDBA285|nr:hypothetical protein [Campylobacter jejuni]EKQ1039775.1 hypothetical protein [Campylobacter jejuni]
MNWIRKMADFSIFKQKYKQYEDTLRNTSYDRDNKEYLCLKENKVINFEKLSLDLETHKGVKKVDALFCQTDQIFLVEFKNQKQSNIEKEDIKGKFKDSVLLLRRLFKEDNIAFKEYNIYLYLVMKNVGGVRLYKERQSGSEIEHAIKADDFFKKFVIKCTTKQYFLPIYKKIFNESCQK